MKKIPETSEEYWVDRILEKMCSYVGKDHTTVDKKTQWYLEHEWTLEQRDDFKKWLVEELKKKGLFLLLTGYYKYNRKTRKIREEIAESFINNYGWKEKKENILQQQEKSINIRK